MINLNTSDMKNKLGLAVLLGAVCGVAYADVPLNVVRGEQDTVYQSKHYVVGVTAPSAVATINGNVAKVYKTGSFGAELQLKEGVNDVEIVVENSGEQNSKRFSVFYAKERPQKKYTLAEAKEIAEKSTLKSVDFNAVTKQGAYLQYGDGDDRLGGSKMGFIDAGIILRVVGEKDGLYKVQLSQNRYAFMDKDYLDKTDKEPQKVNTGSWRVAKSGNYDKVSVSLPCRLAYYSWTELEPTRICVDVFGAMDNSNWMTQLDDTDMVEYVDFKQIDSDVYRIIINLKQDFVWGYSVAYEGNNLVIKVKHAPAPTLKGMKIGLDAGHGGAYPGAISASGLKEKDVNLSLVNEVKALLEAKGAKVVLSRDGDQGPTMAERKKIFKDAEVDLMISIHNNSGGSPLVEMGSCTAYKHLSNRKLAVAMQRRLVELGHKNFGVIGNFNFSLNAPTEYPNVLLEVLFMSSLPEEEKLADKGYHKKVAKQVLLALEDYIKEVKDSQKK